MRWLYPEGWLIPPTNPTHPRARARRPTHIRPQRPRSIALTTPDPDPPAPTLPPPDTGRKPRRETPVRGRTRPPPRPVSLWQSPHHTRSTLPTPRPKGHQYAPFAPCSRALKRCPYDPHTIPHHTTTTPPHTHLTQLHNPGKPGHKPRTRSVSIIHPRLNGRYLARTRPYRLQPNHAVHTPRQRSYTSSRPCPGPNAARRHSPIHNYLYDARTRCMLALRDLKFAHGHRLHRPNGHHRHGRQ